MESIKRKTLGLLLVLFLLALNIQGTLGSLTFRGNASDSNDLYNYTFYNLDIGTADNDRFIIYTGAVKRDAGTTDLMGSVNGISATSLVECDRWYSGPDKGMTSTIFIINVPEGETANISFYHDDLSPPASLRGSLSYYTAIGIINDTAYTVNESENLDPNVTLNMLENSFMVSTAVYHGVSATNVFTGHSEDFHMYYIEGGNDHMGGSTDVDEAGIEEYIIDVVDGTALAGCGAFAGFQYSTTTTTLPPDTLTPCMTDLRTGDVKEAIKCLYVGENFYRDDGVPTMGYWFYGIIVIGLTFMFYLKVRSITLSSFVLLIFMVVLRSYLPPEVSLMIWGIITFTILSTLYGLFKSD